MHTLLLAQLNYFEHLKLTPRQHDELINEMVLFMHKEALKKWRTDNGLEGKFKVEHPAWFGDPEGMFLVSRYNGDIILTCENKTILDEIERLYPYPA